jgi:hypothetical protein
MSPRTPDENYDLHQYFEKNITEDDFTHLNEIVTFHDLSRDLYAGKLEQFCTRSKDNLSNRCLHHNFFTTDLVIRLFDFLDIEILNVTTNLPLNFITAGRMYKTGVD